MPRNDTRTFDQRLFDFLNLAMGTLQSRLKRQLEQQGHVLTGKLRDSIAYKITIEGGKFVATMEAEGYGIIIDTGITPNRIPFSGRTGRGGTSKYIQVLVRFFVLRKGLTEREALKPAFATAYTQKREGMPTRGSYGYSRNGQRLNWIKTTLSEFSQQLSSRLKLDIGLVIQAQYAGQLQEIEPLIIKV